ncbi:MAG: flavodoxin-dependent (E)-4-hydroxy-3-methylbut-2-enyl-diphosphate synthase [Chitinivibrionales bacterium]|nr:flavodoxin-dependent (E)-4-hydroxy-3-methylbut-2-enyl-diphosphate synthase [Chitinivibrionales bacterium]MBD3356050.1 flavodoxin-dependent (E)-4-hydroxy-3-methylbut-2-enyl-diphosphate synthase [Chitinivibrionales bacterium]
MIERRKTRQVRVRDVLIGGNAPVSVQSMTNTDTEDVEATLAQVEELARLGCALVRVAVPNEKAVRAFEALRRETDVPLVADIHFQHRLAIRAVESGADKIRINPGNIGDEHKVKEVVEAARHAQIPIRVGVNAGSVEKNLLEKHGGATAEALLESALGYAHMMERFNFGDVVFSIKASDVVTTIEACRLLARHTDYPQHIGITESGTPRTGAVRSAVGIGTLLAEGIGNTVRVSLAGNPTEEVPVAREILKALGLADGPTVVACPTCGRTRISVAQLAEEVEKMVGGITVPLKIAVMGCVVNGPGEARDADVGIAGGRGEGRIFVKGEPVARVNESDMLTVLWEHIRRIVDERNGRSV